jgi:hypothetical protein
MAEPSDLQEQRRLMGLSPRYQWSLDEGVPGEGGETVDDPRHPDSPEDDEPELATPSPDEQDPPNVQGSGAAQHWDMYRDIEEKAKDLAMANMEMYERLTQVTEGEMDREQRRALKAAQLAVREAVAAQKVAFRRLGEFGSTMLGK